jgi:hypothetical protein
VDLDAAFDGDENVCPALPALSADHLGEHGDFAFDAVRRGCSLL